MEEYKVMILSGALILVVVIAAAEIIELSNKIKDLRKERDEYHDSAISRYDKIQRLTYILKHSQQLSIFLERVKSKEIRTDSEAIHLKKQNGSDLVLTYAGLCEILRSIAAEAEVSKAVAKPVRKK